MTDCIMWHKSIKDTGYGQRFFNGKIARAHRAAWIESNGDIPTGLIVDHTCHNEAALKGECEGGKTCKHRACVNVEHLRLITVSENNKAGLLNRDNRKVCPKGHPNTEENTMVRKSGKRECSECNRIRARANYAKKVLI